LFHTKKNKRKGANMTLCEVCGTEYDPMAHLNLSNEIGFFDQFEAAFYSIPPICIHCKHPILKNGIEAAGVFFCCVHCACQYQTARSNNRARIYPLDKLRPGLGETQ
jgi:hypothetical protein